VVGRSAVTCGVTWCSVGFVCKAECMHTFSCMRSAGMHTHEVIRLTITPFDTKW
jgi:hypothetical protein